MHVCLRDTSFQVILQLIKTPVRPEDDCSSREFGRHSRALPILVTLCPSREDHEQRAMTSPSTRGGWLLAILAALLVLAAPASAQQRCNSSFYVFPTAR